jgi:hypothetical protein
MTTGASPPLLANRLSNEQTTMWRGWNEASRRRIVRISVAEKNAGINDQFFCHRVRSLFTALPQ